MKPSPSMSPFHWVFLASLYTAQFLPVAFFFMGLPVILRTEGFSLEQISALYGLGFIWILKFLWAPLIDRLRFGRLGHYRIWLLLMQMGIAVMLLVISTLDATSEFTLFVVLAMVMTAFAATQDIATDAIACRLLPSQQRGLGNGVQIGGGLLGMIIGAGGMLVIYPYLGWQFSLIALAGFECLAIIPVLLFRETSIPSPQTSEHAESQPFWKLWQQAGMLRWALKLVFLNLGVSIAFALLPPLLVDWGWQVGPAGLLLNVIAPMVSLPVALWAGRMMYRGRSKKILPAALCLQLTGVAGLLLNVLYPSLQILAPLVILLIYIGHHAVMTVVLSEMMVRVISGNEGGDFSSQHSLFLLTGFVGGALALQLVALSGYATGFGVSAIVLCCALAFHLRSKREYVMP